MKVIDNPRPVGHTTPYYDELDQHSQKYVAYLLRTQGELIEGVGVIRGSNIRFGNLVDSTLYTPVQKVRLAPGSVRSNGRAATVAGNSRKDLIVSKKGNIYPVPKRKF